MALFMLIVVMLAMYGAGFVVGRMCGRSDVERERAVVERAVVDVVMRRPVCYGCGADAGTCEHTTAYNMMTR